MNLLEPWYSDIKTTRNDIALIPINTDDVGNMKKTIKFQENIPYSFKFYIDKYLNRIYIDILPKPPLDNSKKLIEFLKSIPFL